MVSNLDLNYFWHVRLIIIVSPFTSSKVRIWFSSSNLTQLFFFRTTMNNILGLYVLVYINLFSGQIKQMTKCDLLTIKLKMALIDFLSNIKYIIDLSIDLRLKCLYLF